MSEEKKNNGNGGNSNNDVGKFAFAITIDRNFFRILLVGVALGGAGINHLLEGRFGEEVQPPAVSGQEPDIHGDLYGLEEIRQRSARIEANFRALETRLSEREEAQTRDVQNTANRIRILEDDARRTRSNIKQLERSIEALKSE